MRMTFDESLDLDGRVAVMRSVLQAARVDIKPTQGEWQEWIDEDSGRVYWTPLDLSMQLRELELQRRGIA